MCGLKIEISAGEDGVEVLRSSELEAAADLVEENVAPLPGVEHASHPLAPADD